MEFALMRLGRRRWSGFAIGMALIGAAAAGRAWGADTGPAVRLSVQGSIATMDNGIVTVKVDLSEAEVESIRFRGHDMVNTAGRHRSIYFSRDGGADYETLPHCIGRVIAQTPEMAEVSCRHVYEPGRDKHGWDVEVRFALRRGVSGLYVMAETSHPANYPKLGVGEWRMVWSTPESERDELPNIYVDELRHWRAPTPMELSRGEAVPGAPKEVTRLTSGPWAGKLDCKYEYAARYWDLGCWGFASEQSGNGAFVVFGSHEFFNDGPNKQDLDAAVGTTLVHMNMNHYDGTSFTIGAGEEWHKCYGPWLLYVNHADSADGCWQDAQARARLEAQAWPYAWVNSDDYPLAEQRGSVSGKLVVHDGLAPAVSGAGAWVGLAAPGEAYRSVFQFQAKGYQFWTRAGADGSFSIPAVRPGNYSLYAYVSGSVGEFQRSGVAVAAGPETGLGTVVWSVPHAGRTLAWQIGVPDRTAEKFALGKEYFEPLLYQKLWRAVPNPLEFTVGVSDAANDWYYAQTRHAIGGSDEQFEPAKWRIHFKLDAEPSGAATLVLALAGADRARLGIYVNNEREPLTTFTPTVSGGNGLIREADHTKYSVGEIAIPAERLHAGMNTIALVQESTREPSSYIMYDSVRLELP